MERLTYWNNKEKNSALPISINDLGDTVSLEDICAKLATYEDAEEKGLLVRLPCKVGALVSVLEKNMGSRKYNFVRERFVNSFSFSIDGYNNMQLVVPTEQYLYPIADMFLGLSHFGNTVFLTREDAEKTLEESK